MEIDPKGSIAGPETERENVDVEPAALLKHFWYLDSALVLQAWGFTFEAVGNEQNKFIFQQKETIFREYMSQHLSL